MRTQNAVTAHPLDCTLRPLQTASPLFSPPSEQLNLCQVATTSKLTGALEADVEELETTPALDYRFSKADGRATDRMLSRSACWPTSSSRRSEPILSSELKCDPQHGANSAGRMPSADMLPPRGKKNHRG